MPPAKAVTVFRITARLRSDQTLQAGWLGDTTLRLPSGATYVALMDGSGNCFVGSELYVTYPTTCPRLCTTPSITSISERASDLAHTQHARPPKIGFPQGERGLRVQETTHRQASLHGRVR
jgi:hypothetical protein